MTKIPRHANQKARVDRSSRNILALYIYTEPRDYSQPFAERFLLEVKNHTKIIASVKEQFCGGDDSDGMLCQSREMHSAN
ncbi:MAG: hypothetical protein ACTSU9_17865 [Promethearchaeota archaeon]